MPCDIVSVSPFTRKSVPSVVTKDGTRSSSVTQPLTQPDTPQRQPRLATGPAQTGAPAAAAKYMTNGASAKTMPAERSISPPIINMISPQAMIAAGATNCDRFSRLALVEQEVVVGTFEPRDQQQGDDQYAGFRPAHESAPECADASLLRLDRAGALHDLRLIGAALEARFGG